MPLLTVLSRCQRNNTIVGNGEKQTVFKRVALFGTDEFPGILDRNTRPGLSNCVSKLLRNTSYVHQCCGQFFKPACRQRVTSPPVRPPPHTSTQQRSKLGDPRVASEQTGLGAGQRASRREKRRQVGGERPRQAVHHSRAQQQRRRRHKASSSKKRRRRGHERVTSTGTNPRQRARTTGLLVGACFEKKKKGAHKQRPRSSSPRYVLREKRRQRKHEGGGGRSDCRSPGAVQGATVFAPVFIPELQCREDRSRREGRTIRPLRA